MTGEEIKTQLDNQFRKYAMTRIASEFRVRRKPSCPYRVYAVESLRVAVNDVETWSRLQDQNPDKESNHYMETLINATRSYGWLIGMPTDVPVHEVCEFLCFNHDLIMARLEEIDRIDVLRRCLITMLSDQCLN